MFYSHIFNNERFVDEDELEEYVLQQQPPPTYIPTGQTIDVPPPVPPAGQQNLQQQTTTGMNNTDQPPQQIDLENLSRNEELAQFINQTLLNQNLAGNGHHTIVQSVRVPDVSQMIQALNLQNPDFIEILKNNSTIPAPGTEGSKSAGDDDKTP